MLCILNIHISSIGRLIVVCLVSCLLVACSCKGVEVLVERATAVRR